MKKERVEKLIKKKFGSLSEFCRAADIDRYDFQKKWNRKPSPDADWLELIASLVASTDQTGIIPKEEVKRVSKLVEEAGGITKFCQDNTQFNRITIIQVLRNDRVRGSRVFEQLVEFFKDK